MHGAPKTRSNTLNIFYAVNDLSQFTYMLPSARAASSQCTFVHGIMLQNKQIFNLNVQYYTNLRH